MDENKLSELLEKYWRAETTTDEERLIEEYFVQNENDNSADAFFAAKRAAKNVALPADLNVQWKNTLPINRHYRWLLNAAAVILVLGFAAALLLVKQHTDQAERVASQKQLEADLNLMFNVVNDSYNDVTTSADHLTK